MKKPNIFKGRTKEWDTNDWQGRTKEQVESNYKVMGYGFIIGIGLIIGYVLISLFNN
tara:strand:- start:395 stop:565 length:171 start_codon:yes stop_codon:yes gene_type:complete